MSAAALLEYGLVRVARIELPNDYTFSIVLENIEAAEWEKSIYVFLVGDAIKRVGSSKGRLGRRLSSWNRGVTAALNGKKSSTPVWEAIEWRTCLKACNGGAVYARVATQVSTPVGTFEAYMDGESVLINRFKPPLNRHPNR